MSSTSILLLSLVAGFLHPQDGPDVDLRLLAEPGVLRVTAVMNLAFLDEIARAPREQEDLLHPSELPALKHVLDRLVSERCPVAIDGERALPTSSELVLLPVAEDELFFYPVTGLKGVTRVRLELRFALPERPRAIGLTWGFFPPNLAIADRAEAGPITVASQWTVFGEDRIVTFEEREPEYVWHVSADAGAAPFSTVPAPEAARSTPVPWLSIGLVVAWALALAVWWPRRRRTPGLAIAVSAAVVLGCAYWARDVRFAPGGPPAAAPPTEEEAIAIFRPLLANVYAAFDFAEEERIYDALARSIDGPLLDRVYDEIFRSLVMQEEGGAVSRVQSLELLGARLDRTGHAAHPAAFSLQADWRVDASVFHWGHTHERSNVYVARFTVAPRDGGWRIVGHETLGQRRVEPASAAGDAEEREKGEEAR